MGRSPQTDDGRNRSGLSQRLTELVAPGATAEADSLREALRRTEQRLREREGELETIRDERDRLRAALIDARSQTESVAVLQAEEAPRHAEPEDLAPSLRLTERLQVLSDKELAETFAAVRDTFITNQQDEATQMWIAVARSIVVEASGRPAFSSDAEPGSGGRFARKRDMQLLRDAVNEHHEAAAERKS